MSMEGLHYRRPEKVNKEDEAEFLDEEEQEKLINELRQQNDTANMNIQRGLIVIGLVVSSLFFNILIQGDVPTIPITAIYRLETSVLKAPKFAAILSIMSLFMSILTLVVSSRIKLVPFIQIPRVPARYAAASAATLGTIPPIMSLSHHSTSIELLFWTIPIILMAMYYLAYSMINQVYEGLEELEGSKYKYKGA